MKINYFFSEGIDLSVMLEGLESEAGEVNLVSAEYKGKNVGYSDFKGLETALALNPEVAPIILCSFMPVEFLTGERFGDKFFALMAKKRVGFLQLPFGPEELLAKYHELLRDEKQEDLLAIEINRLNTYEHEMGTIRHSANIYFDKDDDHAKGIVGKAILDARALGLTGTDEEIATQIKNFEYKPKNSAFAGKSFPGVFCDVEGTLLVDGEVNRVIMATLKVFSKIKPVTLWTGGKIEEIKKILRENGIVWKLVSKYDFAGSEVEIAIDDEDESVFFSKYGIKVIDYLKI